jgi:putative ABC transport system substrate-binding protein
MHRRSFFTLLGTSAAAWPLAARAQQGAPGKVWRIGFIVGASPPALFGQANMAGFIKGMHDLGYVEGRDYVMEWRTALGHYERFPAIVAELVQLKVDVIVTGTAAAVRPALELTSTIPIVMTGMNDPVGRGIIASLARPGGSVTGLASSQDDSTPKQLELLAETIPGLRRVGLLINPTSSVSDPVVDAARVVAQKVRLDIVLAHARDSAEIERAFATLSGESVGAVLIYSDAVYFVDRQHLVEIALKYRLPTMFAMREYVEAGGLMSYGEPLYEFYRRAAAFVDKIFKGAKPAELPVEQPTRFHLVINRKTADALGVTIPALLYIFADEVIE